MYLCLFWLDVIGFVRSVDEINIIIDYLYTEYIIAQVLTCHLWSVRTWTDRMFTNMYLLFPVDSYSFHAEEILYVLCKFAHLFECTFRK